MRDAAFEIGDRVYYNLPEGPEGLIVSLRYYPEADKWEYLVAWGAIESSWCASVELEREKQYT